MLDRLLRKAQRDELLAQIRPALDGGVIAPLRGSSVSLAIALLYQDAPQPSIVVVPKLDDAEALALDLMTLLPDQEILYYPELEILPYDNRSPYKGIVGQQVEVLHRILSGTPNIVVVSAKGLKWKQQPPEEILDYTLTLRKGEELDYDDLLGRFGEMGYYSVPRVETPGDFARKGGILDVFSVSHENPIRIELFGDEIESIRFFDATTQRSLREMDEVFVSPCSPLILSQQNVDRALAAVRQAETTKERQREELLEHIQEKLHFEGMERFAAHYSARVLLPEFFMETPRIFWVDPEVLTEQFKRLGDEIERLFGDCVHHGHPVPKPAAIYASNKELLELTNKYPATYLSSGHTGQVPFCDLVDPEDELGDLEAKAKRTHVEATRMQIQSPVSYEGRIPALRRDLEKRLDEGQKVHIFCDNQGQADRLGELLEDLHERLDFPVGELHSGFILAGQGVVVLTDREIFQRYKRRQRRRKYRTSQKASAYSELVPGDFVVHVNYGIARYLGIEKIKVEESEIDCLKLGFAGGDKIFVTVEQLNMVEKYVGKESVQPALTKLGGASWERIKERAKKAINDMADELLKMAAIRKSRTGHSYSADNQLIKELAASFLYEETPDQLTAIEDVRRDMESPVPMERLICGDVGFGKTEVAIRGAFKAVMDHRQVAVLVPTTILAQQHYTTFRERLADFPVNIEMLSRLRSAKEQKAILGQLKDGHVDIVIGTHRLLSKDVQFKSLGLMVIDEEHRFGVKHKERLKRFDSTVDILSMSATPIPRTLNMAFSGLRDMSLIHTAPRDRLPIQTEILPFDEEIIVEAILRELDRGGQTFFVHNRVESIDAMAGYIKRIVPTARVAIGHGQMHEKALEKVMLEFLDQKYDVLVATMIIESGLDIPSVNTLIVNRADRLGLAQLYQLRGRVGRSNHKAYAHFMVPRGGKTTDLARKRLSALQEFESLGSGLRIAMRDMEIRGAGNILGSQQHGQMIAIGFELYCKLLEQTVAELQGKELAQDISTVVNIDMDYRIPQQYIPDAEEKMAVYKRVAAMAEVAEIQALAEELTDRYGSLPETADTLLRVQTLRILGWKVGVDRIRVRKGQAVLSLRAGLSMKRSQIEQVVHGTQNKLGFDVADRFKIIEHLRPPQRLQQVESLLETMVAATEES